MPPSLRSSSKRTNAPQFPMGSQPSVPPRRSARLRNAQAPSPCSTAPTSGTACKARPKKGNPSNDKGTAAPRLFLSSVTIPTRLKIRAKDLPRFQDTPTGSGTRSKDIGMMNLMMEELDAGERNQFLTVLKPQPCNTKEWMVVVGLREGLFLFLAWLFVRLLHNGASGR